VNKLKDENSARRFSLHHNSSIKVGPPHCHGTLSTLELKMIRSMADMISQWSRRYASTAGIKSSLLQLCAARTFEYVTVLCI